MSRELAVAHSSDDVMVAALSHLRDAFASDITVLLLDGEGNLARTDASEAEVEPDVELAARSMSASGARGAGLTIVLEQGTRLVPLSASTGTVGVLVVRRGTVEPFAHPSHGDLLDTFASQIALAIERARLAEDAHRAQLEVQKERLRNALLSTVSHDLRTPLAVIKGAVTALMESQTAAPASRRGEYLATISEEASRLDRLVRNLLDMTSLEAGSLRVRNKEWQSLEEVIGVALNRLEEQLGSRPVVVRIPSDAALAPFDATLVGQVIINLVENAIKYTPLEAVIEINARPVEQGVEVEVADSGPGVPSGQEETIFEKFHRAAHTSRGMGIGLTICRGIVVAHGGRIWYEHRKPVGSSFRFVLPRDAAGPAMDRLPEVSGDP
jgi:two-component system, OmpR family, sensor histidine kinase KdpD